MIQVSSEAKSKYVQTTHAHQCHEGNPRPKPDLQMINNPSWEQRADEIGNDVQGTAHIFRHERSNTLPGLCHIIPEVGNRCALEYRKKHEGSAIADCDYYAAVDDVSVYFVDGCEA